MRFFCDKHINMEHSYTLDEGAKCFIRGSRPDFNNDEGSGKEITIGCDDKKNEETLKLN